MAHHNHNHKHHQHSPDLHGHDIYGELMCHLPQAIFSVALALVVLSLVTFFSSGFLSVPISCKGAHMLFHNFHFMHIAFAATGAVVTFSRFSINKIKALLVGVFCPIIFCTLSDVIIPYVGGRLLGVNMALHICLLREQMNIIPFVVIGIINGFALRSHPEVGNTPLASISHGIHIFMSSLAATFYMVSHGFLDWYLQIGMVFFFLVIAVVIPCTLSDIVIPIALAKAKNEKYPL